MRLLFIITLLLSLFPGCKKWKYGYEDTQFRNQFVGLYLFDSIVNHHISVSTDGVVGDTDYTILPQLDDFIEILPTKNQVEKNVTCRGKFLDTAFQFDVQGFKDKGAERLSFNPCENCDYSSSIFFKYVAGVRYIISNQNNKLIIETWYKANDEKFFSRTYLTKK